VRPVRFDPALGDVADEQVRTAGVAEFPDLPQQLLDRDRGVFGAALAQVVAVGIDQRGPVLRRADEPLRLGGAGIPLDRVQRQAEPPRAFQQAGALAQQIVDFPPPLRGRPGPLAFLDRRPGRGPARGVRRNLPLGGLGQAVPQVPPVPALHRVRQRRADSLAIGPRPVTGDNLDAGVPAEPVLDDVGGASFEDIDAPAGLGVDQDARVDLAAAQREVIHSQHPGHGHPGQRNRQQSTQRGVPRQRNPERGQQRRPGPAR
jgi:hypothetical protein